MPPPVVTLLPVTLLFVSDSVPAFQTPPATSAVLSATVLFVTVSVPVLKIPPPQREGDPGPHDIEALPCRMVSTFSVAASPLPCTAPTPSQPPRRDHRACPELLNPARRDADGVLLPPRRHPTGRREACAVLHDAQRRHHPRLPLCIDRDEGEEAGHRAEG